MAAPRKTKTGMEESLAKLFGTQGMIDTIESIDRVQSSTEQSLNVSTPTSIADLPQNLVPVAELSKSPDRVIVDRQTVTTSDSQTVRHYNSQTDTPHDSQTVKQLNPPTGRQLNTETVRHVYSQTDKLFNGHTVTQKHDQTVIPTTEHTITPSQATTVTQSNSNTVTPPKKGVETVSYQTIPLDVLTLPYNQAAVLAFLIHAGGTTNARAVSDHTHIGIPSVRDAISRLIRRGFLPAPVTVKNAAFQGFSYVLNPTMVNHFISLGGIQQKNYQTVSQLDSQTVPAANCNTAPPSNSLTPHSSSKETRELTTTNQDYVDQLDSFRVKQLDVGIRVQSDGIRPDSLPFILIGPTGMYWEGEGLQESQARKWCEQFEVEPEQMKQQLEWARYDLVTNGKLAEVRKDSISWFFGCLRQTGGCYSKPVNYKSPTEIRAEQMEQAAKDAASARERQTAAEQELFFQQILSDSEGDAYRQLLLKVSDFAKDMGGKVLEDALRDIFTGTAP